MSQLETPANDAATTEPPAAIGSFADAGKLRRWSFLQRTPQQRLDWLIAALRIAYQSGALKPRRPLP